MTCDILSMITKLVRYTKFIIKYIHIGIFISYRWQKLLADSESRKQTLLRLQDKYRQIEDLYLTFAKKASGFNSWFENAEEDLTDPVRCNSVEEMKVRPPEKSISYF